MVSFTIFDKLGGRDAVIRKLRTVDCWRTPKAFQMWHERKSIPGQVQIGLMKIAEREGVPFQASDFEAIEDPPATAPEPPAERAPIGNAAE